MWSVLNTSGMADPVDVADCHCIAEFPVSFGMHTRSEVSGLDKDDTLLCLDLRSARETRQDRKRTRRRK